MIKINNITSNTIDANNKDNKEKLLYIPLPYWHQCPLSGHGMTIPIVSLNYYDVCDNCRKFVRQYTVPDLLIKIAPPTTGIRKKKRNRKT
mgnify:CR=1 FL=1|jgi:hypothetical protein